MENRGLLFIPDISGFTRFINETEIEHSRLIIQELLELIINSNRCGLEVSEVEGDAILFYRFGQAPAIEELYQQVQHMFCSFHQQLLAYEYRRYCQCKACTSAIGLSLKIVSHYGEFTGYSVKAFQKLLGRDVIVAHQLLKNDIDQHEYWLVTDSLSGDEPPKLEGWMKWNKGAKQTDTGVVVPFNYVQLGPLKNLIEPEPLNVVSLSNKTKVLSVSREYKTNLITLFHASGDFSHRKKWQEGVREVEELTHFLPRIGMRCRYILENGETNISANSYSFSPEHIEFSETDEKDNSTMFFTLHKNSENSVTLTIDVYLSKGLLAPFLFRLNKKKTLEEKLKRSLEKLQDVVNEIKLPDSC